MRAILLVLLLASCAHGPDHCESGRLTTPLDQKRADRVLVALTASPTWQADLNELTKDVGRARVNCYVRADDELLVQMANLSTDDSFVVEPHIAIAIERAREWLKNGVTRGVCK